MNKHFKKIKNLVEGIDKYGYDEDEVNDAKQKISSDREDSKLKGQLEPSGETGDQKIRAPQDAEGNILTTTSDEVMDRQNPGTADRLKDPDAHHDQLGTGVHGAAKQKGFWKSVQRGMNTFKSLKKIYKQGAPVLPVRQGQYEDETGKIREFGKINTGMANADPYYFEFDHLDIPNNQLLVLYGTANSANSSNAYSRPITLRVKTIIPNIGDKDPNNPDDFKLKPEENLEEARKNRKSKMRQSRDKKREKRAKYKPGSMKREQPPEEGSPESHEGEHGFGAQTDDEKRDPGFRLTIGKLMNHPAIKALLERYRLLDQIERRVKIGGVYGIMNKKDPGDNTSRWKIYRKIQKDYFPPIIFEPEFPDEFDNVMAKILNLEPDKSAVSMLGLGAIGLAARESGLMDTRSVKEVAMAVIKYAEADPEVESEPDADPAPPPTNTPEGEPDTEQFPKTPVEIPGRKPGGSRVGSDGGSRVPLPKPPVTTQPSPVTGGGGGGGSKKPGKPAKQAPNLGPGVPTPSPQAPSLGAGSVSPAKQAPSLGAGSTSGSTASSTK